MIRWIKHICIKCTVWIWYMYCNKSRVTCDILYCFRGNWPYDESWCTNFYNAFYADFKFWKCVRIQKYICKWFYERNGFFLFQRWNLAENHCKFTMLLPKLCSRFSSYMLNTTRKQRNTSVLLTQCFYKYGSFTTVNSFSNLVTAAGKRNVYIFSQRQFHDSSKVLKLLGTTRPLNPPGKVRRNRRRSGSQVWSLL